MSPARRVAKREADSSSVAGARPLRAVMREYLEASGLARRIKQKALFAAWEAAVGEKTAAQARIVDFRRQTLRIEAASAALLQDLAGFRKQELLEEINRRLAGAGYVEDIKFQIGDFSEAAEL